MGDQADLIRIHATSLRKLNKYQVKFNFKQTVLNCTVDLLAFFAILSILWIILLYEWPYHSLLFCIIHRKPESYFTRIFASYFRLPGNIWWNTRSEITVTEPCIPPRWGLDFRLKGSIFLLRLVMNRVLGGSIEIYAEYTTW